MCVSECRQSAVLHVRSYFEQRGALSMLSIITPGENGREKLFENIPAYLWMSIVSVAFQLRQQNSIDRSNWVHRIKNLKKLRKASLKLLSWCSVIDFDQIVRLPWVCKAIYGELLRRCSKMTVSIIVYEVMLQKSSKLTQYLAQNRNRTISILVPWDCW